MLQVNPIVLETLLRLSRSTAVRRGVLAAILPFVGVVAAFGIAPDTVTDKVVVAPVVETRALQPVAASSAADDTYWREERIQRSDTFASLLARLRIEDADAISFLRGSDEAKGLRQLVPGRIVRAQTDENGRLRELRYSTGVMVLKAKPEGAGFRVSQEVAPLERRILMRSAEIKTSLFAATDAA